MTQNQTQKADTRSASQKIADLENGLMSLYQVVDNIARDMGTFKQAIKLLGNKVDSIVQASERGEAINDSVISRIMVENNADELKQKLSTLIAQGVLKAEEQVGDDSFVVARELDADDKVINPRLQFAVAAVQPDVQEKVKGAKAGDTIIFQEGKLKLHIQEVYSVQSPEAQAESMEAQEAQAEAAAAPASESAPAQEEQAAPAAEAQAAVGSA